MRTSSGNSPLKGANSMQAWDYQNGLPVNILHKFQLENEEGDNETLIIFNDWSSLLTNQYSEHASSYRMCRSILQFEHLWNVCMVHVQYNLNMQRVYVKDSHCDPSDWKALMDYLQEDFDESCKRTITRKGEECVVDVFTAEFFDGTAEAVLYEEGWTVTYSYEEL